MALWFAGAKKRTAKTCQVVSSQSKEGSSSFVSPGPPLIKEVIQEAEILPVENVSDADDDSVVMKETLHRAVIRVGVRVLSGHAG